MTSIDTPNNPKANRPITPELVLSAVTTAIEDRNQAVRNEWGDDDAFREDEERLIRILAHLDEHVLREKRLSVEDFQAFRIAVERMATNQLQRGEQENYEALCVLEEGVKLLQQIAEQGEVSPAANKADALLNQMLAEQGFERMVELLMRGGFTRREVEERIAECPYL
jgi:hypothetical protein